MTLHGQYWNFRMEFTEKRVTIRMVADRAGVSRASVYAVLNPDRQSNIGVSAATREKVEHALRELGYIPNNSAKTLGTGRSRIVGILLNNPEQLVTRRMSREFMSVFHRNGYMVHLEYHYGSAENERERLAQLFSQAVELLILDTVGGANENADLVARFVGCRIPVIALGLDNDTIPGAIPIAFDEPMVMRLIVDHLAEIGRFHPVLFRVPGNSGKGREIHFRSALARHPEMKNCGAFEVASFEQCMYHLRKLTGNGNRPFDAVVCYNDELASTLINCLARVGIHVPDDVVVTGIDGDVNPFFPLPITSVYLPMEELAQQCWMKFEAIRKNVPGGTFPRIVPQLLVRESTVSRIRKCM